MTTTVEAAPSPITRTHCGLCEREFQPGVTAYLCHACMCSTRERLQQLPGLYRLLGAELTPSMANPFEPRVSGGGGPIPLPLDEEVLEMRVQTGFIELLEDWRNALYADLGYDRPAPGGGVEARVTAVTESLRAHLLWIAQSWPEAGPLAQAVRAVHRDLRSVVTPPAPSYRIGYCPAAYDGVICGAVLRVVRGATAARCRWCGATYPPDRWAALPTTVATTAAA